MAKQTITYESLGTTWKVHRELIDSPGLTFIQDYLSGYDFSQLEWITLRLGAWGFTPNSIWTNATHGRCWHPHSVPSKLFRINCNINTRVSYPAKEYATIKTSKGKRKVPFLVNDAHEAIVSIVAHEASHYLGSTSQIPASGKKWFDSRPTDEVEAGEFEKAAVEAYRAASRDDVVEAPASVTLTETHDCAECGQRLFSSRARFCSDECRYAYHNRQRHKRGESERQKVCEVCGAEFASSRKDAKTCSARCRQRLRRARPA